MGSSSSKAARTAGAAARQYPKRPAGAPAVPPQATSSSQPTTEAAAPSSEAPPSPPPQAAERTKPGPTVRPQPHATTAKSEEINLDASDPDFARSLRELGPVQPNPTMSPTSAFPHPNNPNNPLDSSSRSQSSRPLGPNPRQNPAIVVLDARAKLQQQAEDEFMNASMRGFGGRQFLDVFTIRQMFVMRDEQGKSAGEIEKALGLRRGAVARLGAPGVAELAREATERGRVDMV